MFNLQVDMLIQLYKLSGLRADKLSGLRANKLSGLRASQSLFFLLISYYCVLCREAANTNIIIYGFIRDQNHILPCLRPVC